MGLLQQLIKLGYPESTAQKIASGELPMDYASRMARAKEMGFDVDNIYYHGTGSDFTEYDPLKFGQTDGGWFGKGFYFSPDTNVANQYAYGGSPRLNPTLLRANNPYDWRTQDGFGMAQANDEMRYAKTRDILDQGYDSVNVTEDKIKLPDGQKLTDEQWYALIDGNPVMTQLGRDKIEKSLQQNGYNYARFVDTYGKEVADMLPKERKLTEKVVFDPTQIRSAYAAFDPEMVNSSNILAGINPVAAAGTLGLLGAYSNDADAMNVWHGSPHKQLQGDNVPVHQIDYPVVERNGQPAESLTNAFVNPVTPQQQMNDDVAYKMSQWGIDAQEDPRFDYGTILPFRKPKSIMYGDGVELAMPSLLRDIIKGAVTAPTAVGYGNDEAALRGLLEATM